MKGTILLVVMSFLPARALARIDPLYQFATTPCLAASNVPTISHTGVPCPGALDRCLQTALNYGEGINPPTSGPLNFQTDAMTKPELFTIPVDSNGDYVTVKFKLLQEGAGYENIFGWYNAGDKDKHYPALFSCYGGNTYHPPAYDTSVPPKLVGGYEFQVNFQAEFMAGRYLGGQIGLYLITPQGNTTGSMCAADPSTKDQGTLASGGPINDDNLGTIADDANGFGRIFYSEAQYNLDAMGNPEPYSHILIFQSKASPTHFYFAMEDLWSGGDMDYDDIVVKVEGLVSSLTGDYVLGPPGTASSGTTSTPGDWSLITSVEYPGWKGHLRAYDMTQNPPTLEWDAATDLNARGFETRKLFTGFPDYGSPKGELLPLLNAAGNAVADGTKIRAVLTKVNSANQTLTDGQLLPFFQWLHGSGRTHRLPPIMRCVPAVVGQPKARNLTGHDAFVASAGVSNRERLIYVTSNEGLIHAFRSGKASSDGGKEVFAFLPPALFDQVYQLYLAGGQANPAFGFKHILENSPRVDDFYDGTTWSTQLVVPFGPFSKGFVVLDVTRPTDCSASPCSLASGNLNVVALAFNDAGTVKLATSSGTSTLTTQSLGEGWSLPALYWDQTAGTPQCLASMGSGYGAATSADHFVTATAGHYYNYFATPWGVPASYLHGPPGAGAAKVDYAVLADTAAVINWEGANPVVIASYQVDLYGRLIRFRKGAVGVGDDAVLLAADVNRPFYYAPAVLHIGGTATDQVVLALNSGSADESCPPSPDITSKIYLRAHTSGTSFDAGYDLTCDVGSIKTCGTLDVSKITDNSLWPPATAKPIGPPLLVYNDLGGGSKRVEAFYLVYDNASKTSYRVRISVDATDPTKLTVEGIYKTGGRIGGMAVGGGGTRIVMSKSGAGSAPATADHAGNAIAGGALMTGTPRIEVWREVR